MYSFSSRTQPTDLLDEARGPNVDNKPLDHDTYLDYINQKKSKTTVWINTYSEEAGKEEKSGGVSCLGRNRVSVSRNLESSMFRCILSHAPDQCVHKKISLQPIIALTKKYFPT